MRCRNDYCRGTNFVGVIEMDDNILVGVKCKSCGARYSIREIDVLKSVKRPYWNSVRWSCKDMDEQEKK